jgi:hypothetical protein
MTEELSDPASNCPEKETDPKFEFAIAMQTKVLLTTSPETQAKGPITRFCHWAWAMEQAHASLENE